MHAVQEDQEALTLANEAEELSQVLAAIQSTTVQTPDQAHELNELVKEVKRDLKQLETDCTNTTRPTFERLEAMRDWFRPKRTALKEIERVGKLKLAEYALAVKQAQTAAQTAAGQAFAQGNAVAGHAALADIPPPVELEGTSFRDAISFEIIAPDMVPYQLCSPDHAKIAEWLKNTNGSPIPGVKVIRTPRVTTRV